MRSMLAFLYRTLRLHRVDNRILLSFLALAAATFAFVKLSSEVMEGDTLAFDRWLLRALRSAADPAVPMGPGWVQDSLLDITALGGVAVLTIITFFAVGYLLAVRKAAMAAFLAGAIAGGAIVSNLLKWGYARDRPDLVAHLVDVDTSSFPSGHAMNSAIIYLTLGALLARAEKDWWVRVYLLTVAIAVTLAVGFSRVYLGVHWPSDVVAGWCVGGAWAILCSLVARALQRRQAIEPPQSSVDGSEDIPPAPTAP